VLTSYAQANLQQSLRDVKVAQVMVRECPKIAGRTMLGQLVEEQVLTGARRCFVVAENGQLRGMLTLRDIAAIPRENWTRVTAEDAMVPWERLVGVHPNTELLTALQTMDDANVAQVPVMEGHQVVGLLSREQVLHYIRVRAELGM
jgi:predicted transcriptional regulator